MIPCRAAAPPRRSGAARSRQRSPSAAAMDHRRVRTDDVAAPARREFPFINFPPAGPVTAPPHRVEPRRTRRRGSERPATKLDDAQAARPGAADHPHRAEEGARDRDRSCEREIDRIGDDRRKLNQQLIDVAAARAHHRARRSPPIEQRLLPLDDKRAGAARFARRAPARASRNVLAALQRIGRNPPPALLVSAGRRAAIGALGDPARRRAAGRCGRTTEAARSPTSPTLAALRKEIADRTRQPRERTRAALAMSSQRTGLADRAAPETAGGDRKGAGRRAPARRAAGAAGRGPAGTDRQARAGLDRTHARPRGRPQWRGQKKAPDNRPDSGRPQGPRPAGPGDCLRSRQGNCCRCR